VTSPTLIVVSGPAGSGKTTLAHKFASALGCPAICRDEIKEGMVHATPGFKPSPGDPLTVRTLTTFFDVLGLLLRAGVTVVAEAAFQDRLWCPGLEPLTDLAAIRVVRCTVDADVGQARIARRVNDNARRAAHDDHGLLRALASGAHSLDAFVPISLPVPTICVDTTDGYAPGIEEILALINSN
jgi:predicted kinase